MIHHIRLSLPLFFLVLLTSLTFWLDQATQPYETTQDDSGLPSPDYVLEDLSGIRMDHERVAQQTYFAKKMLHYIRDDMTHLESTRFTSTPLDKPRISVVADRAELLGDGTDIYLTGNVEVVRGEEDDPAKLTMNTHSLHLIPDQHIAQTGQPVVITRLASTVKGVGLHLNNYTDVIKLLSRVRAVDLNTKKQSF